VILSIKNGEYYSMDLISSRVWEIIREPGPVSNICDILIEEYDVDRERCENDAINFLNELADKGLVVIDRDHNN